MNLSGGNQQKVMLAKWLVIKPKVLIVDEPTRGVDVGVKADVHQLLRDLANRGVGVIMISSELPEVLGMSDRILVMREGRIAGEVLHAEATEERVMSLCRRRDSLRAACGARLTMKPSTEEEHESCRSQPMVARSACRTAQAPRGREDRAAPASCACANRSWSLSCSILIIGMSIIEPAFRSGANMRAVLLGFAAGRRGRHRHDDAARLRRLRLVGWGQHGVCRNGNGAAAAFRRTHPTCHIGGLPGRRCRRVAECLDRRQSGGERADCDVGHDDHRAGFCADRVGRSASAQSARCLSGYRAGGRGGAFPFRRSSWSC